MTIPNTTTTEASPEAASLASSITGAGREAILEREAASARPVYTIAAWQAEVKDNPELGKGEFAFLKWCKAKRESYIDKLEASNAELLAALRGLSIWVMEHSRCPELNKPLKQAKAAIARAEGRGE